MNVGGQAHVGLAVLDLFQCVQKLCFTFHLEVCDDVLFFVFGKHFWGHDGDGDGFVLLWKRILRLRNFFGVRERG